MHMEICTKKTNHLNNNNNSNKNLKHFQLKTLSLLS